MFKVWWDLWWWRYHKCNLLLRPTVEFLKSLSIWQTYEQQYALAAFHSSATYWPEFLRLPVQTARIRPTVTRWRRVTVDNDDDVGGDVTHAWQSCRSRVRSTCPSCRWFVYRCRAGRLSTNRRASGWWRQRCGRRCERLGRDDSVTSDASESDRNVVTLRTHMHQTSQLLTSLNTQLINNCRQHVGSATAWNVTA